MINMIWLWSSKCCLLEKKKTAKNTGGFLPHSGKRHKQHFWPRSWSCGDNWQQIIKSSLYQMFYILVHNYLCEKVWMWKCCTVEPGHSILSMSHYNRNHRCAVYCPPSNSVTWDNRIWQRWDLDQDCFLLSILYVLIGHLFSHAYKIILLLALFLITLALQKH